MKYCNHCGKELKDDALFCSACGKGCSEEPTGCCRVCGTRLAEDARFCPACGADCAPAPAPKHPKIDDFDDSTLVMPKRTEEHLIDSVTGTIHRLVGGKGAVRPPLTKIFGDIFVKHSRKDSEEIFICGTEATTPVLDDEARAWPKPWLWSRILVAFGAALLMLHLCFQLFDNLNVVPGVLILTAFMVPISMFVFFFEFNTPRNISFFQVIKIFLVGGCASLLVTLVLFELFPVTELDYGGAMVVGIVEEIGKLVIVAGFLYTRKGQRYLVNGLLVGAAVGAGFAAFETAGYIFSAFLSGLGGGLTKGYDTMMEVGILRVLLAPGGHIAWAAIAGFAMVLAMGEGEKKENFLLKGAFWRIFWLPVLCHA
ncbi:MAG: PrsW family intramembrane metalloprotease, partial [Clostridia bacterium]|nr:PrsW family intramembrane metalloprotease [Clostridia bacterium]